MKFEIVLKSLPASRGAWLVKQIIPVRTISRVGSYVKIELSPSSRTSPDSPAQPLFLDLVT